jgi:tRNA pseudouridine55 synthase
MNGILNVLKPPGMTSFDVVAYLRGLLKVKKIGHTGTLDPGAVGVLPVCIGKATKAIEYLMDKDKVYRAELTLGISTDTQDSLGRVVKEAEVNSSEDEIYAAVKSFVGIYSQLPPMYSAIKKNGKKLYELARRGIEVERSPREVTIHFINILSIKENRVVFDVGCSKGTYIRTLCLDIGDKLGCGGHMSFLVRMKAGCFNINDSLTVEQIKEMAQNGTIEKAFIGIEKVFDSFERICLDKEKEKRFLNGGFIKIAGLEPALRQKICVFGENGKILALGETVLNRNGELSLKPLKIFV